MTIQVTPSQYYSCTEQSLEAIAAASNVRYRIPFNQRPWSWQAHHLLEFWNDLVSTRDEFYTRQPSGEWTVRAPQTGEPHFFGAFVFVNTGTSGLYDVMDGQQRLTAITLVVACLREIASALYTSSTDLSVRSKARTLVSQLDPLILSDGPAGSQNPRLLADRQLAPLYNTYIVEPYTANDRILAFNSLTAGQTTLPMQKRLKNGFDKLNHATNTHIEGLSERATYSEVVSIINTLRCAFIAISSVSTHEPFAFKVFQSLNAKGRELLDSDKIKNELFIHAAPFDQTTVKDQWDRILNTVPDGDIGRFLRYQHIGFHSTCPQSKLYETIRSAEVEPANGAIASLLTTWNERADLLSHIHLDQSHPDISGELFERLRDINFILGLSLTWPFLMAAAKRFLSTDKAAFLRCVKLAERFGFRVVTAPQGDGTILETELGEAARRITAGDSVDSVRDNYLKPHSPDSRFEEQFTQFAPRRPKVQFYTLFSIERNRGGGTGLVPAPHSPKQHIEHIMPKRFSNAQDREGEWFWARTDPERHKQHLNRIGNLCILEHDINNTVKNHEFEAKRTGHYPKGKKGLSYKDSALHLPSDLASISITPKWDGFSRIEERQQRLAKEAIETWSLDI